MPPSKSHSIVRLEVFSVFSRRWEDFGIWDSMTEPAASRETAEHTPAGRPTEVYGQRGGLKVGEITLRVAWGTGAFVRGLSFPAVHAALVSQVNGGATGRIWEQAVDDFNSAVGAPKGYVGQLKSVSPHDGTDSKSAEPKQLAVIVHASGVIS